MSLLEYCSDCKNRSTGILHFRTIIWRTRTVGSDGALLLPNFVSGWRASLSTIRGPLFGHYSIGCLLKTSQATSQSSEDPGEGRSRAWDVGIMPESFLQSQNHFFPGLGRILNIQHQFQNPGHVSVGYGTQSRRAVQGCASDRS